MRVLVLSAVVSVVACTVAPRSDEPVEVDSRHIVLSEFSLGFDIPSNWNETQLEHASLYAGPEGTSQFFTPLIVQARPSQAPLDQLLERLADPVADNQGFELRHHALLSVGGVLALHYDLEFELHETLRRRMGVLIPTPDGVVDIALASNASVFAEGLPVFDRLLDSLAVSTRPVGAHLR